MSFRRLVFGAPRAQHPDGLDGYDVLRRAVGLAQVDADPVLADEETHTLFDAVTRGTA